MPPVPFCPSPVEEEEFPPQQMAGALVEVQLVQAMEVEAERLVLVEMTGKLEEAEVEEGLRFGRPSSFVSLGASSSLEVRPARLGPQL